MEALAKKSEQVSIGELSTALAWMASLLIVSEATPQSMRKTNKTPTLAQEWTVCKNGLETAMKAGLSLNADTEQRLQYIIEMKWLRSFS